MAFVSLLGMFFSSFGVALSGAVMPGPVFTAVVGESARRGISAGPLFMIGHAVLEIALVVLICFGLGPLLDLPAVFITTSIAGGAVMLLMAVSMFVSLPRLSFDTAMRGKRYARIAVAGLVLSLSNPYWTVWWVTIGVGWLSRALKLGPAGAISFYAGHIAGDTAWYLLVSFMVSRGKRFLNDTRYRVLIGACAAALAFFGLKFGIDGALRLLGEA